MDTNARRFNGFSEPKPLAWQDCVAIVAAAAGKAVPNRRSQPDSLRCRLRKGSVLRLAALRAL